MLRAKRRRRRTRIERKVEFKRRIIRNSGSGRRDKLYDLLS
jgi:hypothetical protein